MFKGIKKRFASNRSVRNRRLVPGVREQGESTSREPPDKGGSKSTSPRQVHPADQISPVPYARRSLERHSRTIPPGKGSPSSSTRGYDRRTDSFCLSPSMDSSSSAYPTTPNICVMGGKIEFITPPGSTLSSNASGIGSTKSSIYSLSPLNSPVRSNNNPVSSATSNRSQVEKSSLKRLSKKRNSPSKTPLTLSTSSRLPVRKDSTQEPQLIKTKSKEKTDASQTAGSLELRQNQRNHLSGVRRSSTMPEQEFSEEEIETLRRENKEVKSQLADLQKEYQKLQSHFNEFKADRTVENNIIEESTKKEEQLSQYQELVERCTSLEVENAQLQVDSQIQRQQYEKCLDQVASQVVQAIIVQKTQQEQCEKLTKQVEKLRKQNSTLTSFIAAKGHFQSLNLPPHRRRAHHPLPPLLCSTSTSNSQSLPSTLTKAKETDCDKSNTVPDENNLEYNIQAVSTVSNSVANSMPVCSHKLTNALPSSSSSTLPQFKSSYKNRVLHHQTSADACWYDIVKSLQSGDNCTLNDAHNANDPHDLSSDSSSLDPEEQSFKPNQISILPGIEDESSLSSGGEDFHGASICSPISLNGRDETSSSLSNSDSQTQPLFSQADERNFTSNNQLPKRNADFCVNIKTQSAIQQNLVVNFSIGSPEYNESENGILKSSIKADLCSSNIKIEDPRVSEGITKDEGYSTMSSDVQSEVKENVNVCTVSTVEEEKVKNFESESEIKENSESDTLKRSSSINKSIVEVEKCNIRNLSLNLNSSPVKRFEGAPDQEYSDGLRIVYDEEDSNSDVFFVPICEDKDKYLSNSFNFPFPDEPHRLSRCFSDSYLYKIYFRFPNCSHETVGRKLKKLNPSAAQNKNFTLSNPDRNNAYHTYLRRACRRESFKRGCSKYISKTSAANSLKNKLTLNYDVLSQIFSSMSQPRILSPSYSQAEIEDWSLDLSGEDITTPGGTEPSCADSSAAPSHHQSHPSIQETGFDLEEDHHDFLWNGATYFKNDDHELSWPCHKDQNKTWDLNLVGNNNSHSMISPKSGCSDQPAVWSSSEQLSCCSDAASKCSTDIENFCDQLCNLPELKRVSFGSSDNGAPESLHSNLKLSEIDSNEENSEALEDIGIDTVFTRDFYRLVKFESSRSLTASSKSLAASEGFLTLEKLKDLESLHDNKTLASVLGFIAEQQKYCKDREKMDECVYVLNNNKNINEDKVTEMNLGNSCSYKNLGMNSSNFSPDSLESAKQITTGDSENVLTSSESLSCLNIGVNLRNKVPVDSSENLPPKPKRSTSLNLGTKSGFSYRARCTLPPLPSCSCPPPPPRSTSRSTLSHCQVSTLPALHRSTVVDEVNFPPPLPEDPYVEPYHSIPMEIPSEHVPPSVPPHRTPVIPRRSSSKSFENGFCSSPPVPKRITSRALPIPPAEMSLPQRTTSLENSKASHHKYGRPRSLLKEAALSNALNRTHKQRGSCGDLAPICRNSATLMFELGKMAKAEEDEKNNCGMCSPEATSPNTEVGLGTGWVRLEPVVDLGDPKTRANLLDSMLPSSEACSSETDEDLAKQLQHKELLKAVQRNRRKRKASRHNSDRSRILGFHHPRPTILGRESLFNRFGEEEEKALMEFEFLEEFPSQSDVRPLELSRLPGVAGCEASHSDDEPTDSHLEYPSYYFDYSSQTLICRPQLPPPKLEDLRSSEPCPSNDSYPLSSFSLNVADDKKVRESNRNKKVPVCHNAQSLSCKISLCSDFVSKNDSTTSQGGTSVLFPLDKEEGCSVLSNHCVPLKRHYNLSSVQETKLKDTAPQIKHSNHDVNSTCIKNNGSVTNSEEISSINVNNYKDNVENYFDPINTGTSENDHKKTSDGSDTLIDTRSLCNVKATIQKLNKNNTQCSGNSNKCTSSVSNFPIISSASVSRLASRPTSNLSSKANPLSTKKNEEHVKHFNNSDFSVDSSRKSDDMNYLSKGFEGKCVRNKSHLSIGKSGPPRVPDPNSSTFSKRTPRLPGSDLVKKLTSNSSALPVSQREPAKLSDSSFTPKERNSLISRLPKGSGANIHGSTARSPKLPTSKLGRHRLKHSDPLEVFCEKSLGDSGSSEGSERASNRLVRLSISDSCAEVFSHGESGDEVFQKLV